VRQTHHGDRAFGLSETKSQSCLGFPYIFRGALDVRATTINMEMQIAAARALADLAREDVPDEVAAAYGTRPKFGPDYIIPVPFDPRLISAIPPASPRPADGDRRRAQAIVRHGGLRQQLRTPPPRPRPPGRGRLARVFERLKRSPKRVGLCRGEEAQVIRAAAAFVEQGLGTALLVGRENRVRDTAANAGIELEEGLSIVNARLSRRNAEYAAHLY